MKNIIQRSVPLVVFFVLGTLLAMYLVPAELEQMQWEVPGWPDSWAPGHTHLNTQGGTAGECSPSLAR